MITAGDIPFYVKDRMRYGNIYNILFWYKKHKRWGWLKGHNFGDYLSLVIVGEIARKEGLNNPCIKKSSIKLLSVGSIMHYARNGDLIWGTGVNGKIADSEHKFDNLDVRMVRGPLTRDYLREKGIQVPEVFGDPALLLPKLFPEFSWRPETGKIIAIPNLNEIEICRERVPKEIRLISPMRYWKKVIKEILTSELVLTSSLHGLIAAEVFNVPVRFVMPVGGETLFKYKDYFLGTGRDINRQPSTFKEKINENSGIAMPGPVFDEEKIMSTFPRDIFK
ncbi:MAG: polysaccharide pyruvyl transferase family protein [Elusimicrobiota bacterium]